jgi:hypothetical protein
MATKMTTAANAILLQYLSPVYVALLAPVFLKEHTSRRDWIFILLAACGMVMFFLDELSPSGLTGNIFGVLSGIFFAVFCMSLRRVQVRDRALPEADLGGSGGQSPPSELRREYEQYFEEFCAKFDVPVKLAKAIAMQESSMNPWAVMDNATRRSFMFKTREEALKYANTAFSEKKSFDIGLMQINSTWLRKLEVSPAEALEPRFNVLLGVGILALEIERHGLTWQAVAAYHVGGGNLDKNQERSEDYAKSVFNRFLKM